MFKDLKTKWANLPAKNKKIFIFGLIGCVIIVIAVIASQGRRPAVTDEQIEAKRKAQYELLSPDMSHEVLSEKIVGDVQSLRRANRELKEELDKLRETVNNIPSGGTLSDALPGVPGAQGPSIPGSQGSDLIGTSTAAEREFGLRSSLRGMGVLPVQKGNDVYPPIPVQPKVPSQGGLMDGVGTGSTPPLGQPVINLPETEGSQGIVINTPNNNPSVGVADARVMGSIRFNSADSSSPSSAYTGSGRSGGGQQHSQESVKPQTSEFHNFYVPTATHFKVRLLTGLDAPTGPKAQSQPHPLILRVQDLSFLPNEVRQNIAGCHILGEGIGDLSSERARIRGLVLSCVDASDNNVIDEELFGYVADTDGKGSLRGRVVSKQGRFLAMSLQAAFIEGVAQGFQSSGSTTVVSGYGATETKSDIDSFGDGFKQGFASGAGKSAQKLSEFYLKAAEDMYPIIEISANRDATFVVTQGKRFSADKMLFLPVEKKFANHKSDVINNNDL